MSILLQTQKSMNIVRDMAKEAGVPFDKAATMVDVMVRNELQQNTDRRSQPHEKDLVGAELPKLDVTLLSNSNSRELAQLLVQAGVSIRPNVQGVLSFISRKRKQLLLEHHKQPDAIAAE